MGPGCRSLRAFYAPGPAPGLRCSGAPALAMGVVLAVRVGLFVVAPGAVVFGALPDFVANHRPGGSTADGAQGAAKDGIAQQAPGDSTRTCANLGVAGVAGTASQAQCQHGTGDEGGDACGHMKNSCRWCVRLHVGPA